MIEPVNKVWEVRYRLSEEILSFSTVSGEIVVSSALLRLLRLIRDEDILMDKQRWVEICLRGEHK